MEKMTSRVRPPAVASIFYPGDSRTLKQMLGAMLEKAENFQGPKPKALIVPHAGYSYSGILAAMAYKILIPMRKVIRRVVLLGPAHRVYVKGLVAPSVASFATPLGEIPLEEETLKVLAREFAWVQILDPAHALEHSLEVQLPFLQEVLEDFVLLPLVVGDAPAVETARVLERLWGGEETLFVVSSDLSHYHDYDTAVRVDAATARAIETMDMEALSSRTACGVYPLRGLLLVAERKGLVVHRLGICNSGDTTGDRARVVGYGAWMLSEEKE